MAKFENALELTNACQEYFQALDAGEIVKVRTPRTCEISEVCAFLGISDQTWEQMCDYAGFELVQSPRI